MTKLEVVARRAPLRPALARRRRPLHLLLHHRKSHRVTGREGEAGVRGRLDNWRLWVGVAYFGLAAVVVALFFVNQRTQRAIADQQRAAGVHTAEIVANATSQYHLCLASIPELREINAFVAGVKVVHDTLLANSEALLAKTPRSARSTQYVSAACSGSGRPPGRRPRQVPHPNRGGLQGAQEAAARPTMNGGTT